MNAFYEHHEHSIRARYRCFDRILLNADTLPPSMSAITASRLLTVFFVCLGTAFAQLAEKDPVAVIELGGPLVGMLKAARRASGPTLRSK
jgi:hypothetical protein